MIRDERFTKAIGNTTRERVLGLRVLHCPSNIAGVPYQYVKGLRRVGVDARMLTFDRTKFDFEDDICLHLEREHNKWIKAMRKLKAFLDVAFSYDIFHFHFGNSLLPRNKDLPILKSLHKRMVMNYWGSDARAESLAIRRDKYFALTGASGESDHKIRKRLRENSRYIDTAVVANRALLEYVHDYFGSVEIVPVAICLSDIDPVYPSESKEVPVVVHAPSSRDIKGTNYVLEVVQDLRKTRSFEFILVQGLSHGEAMQIYRRADIVIDQVLLEWYGMFAIEAMALGKPVLSHAREDILPDLQGLPIVNTNPDRLRSDLDSLTSDATLRRELGIKGRQYVERVHDCRVVASQLVTLYKKL